RGARVRAEGSRTAPRPPTQAGRGRSGQRGEAAERARRAVDAREGATAAAVVALLPVAGCRLSVVGCQLSVVSGHPRGNTQATGNGQLAMATATATDNRQPTTDNRQPTTTCTAFHYRD